MERNSDACVWEALKMHESTLSHALLDESLSFLECMRLAVTTGKRQVMGKTFLDPKKDSKWERGRTRQVIHFGAHVRGGKAVGAEVEEFPPCLLEVLRLIQAQGLLGSPIQKGDKAEEAGLEKRVTAATVDFFRKGSYAPSLAATAPLFFPPSSISPKPAQSVESVGDQSSRDSAQGGSADTESVLCMLWLQDGGEVVIGNAQQLAACSKFHQESLLTELATGKSDEADARQGNGNGEGLFLGMKRVSSPRGSVMVWNTAQARDLQVAVPSAPRDGVLLSFQTLTAEASSRVMENRREREAAKKKAAMLRRAAKEAKEAKVDKGPIPGTPIVVADWKEQGEGHGDGDGASWTKRPGEDSSSRGISRGFAPENGRSSDYDDGKTPSIEKEHVQAVYNTIAPHWSHTRYKPWPLVEKFLGDLEAYSLVADAGCGNGKYLGCDAAGGFLLGSDASLNLLHVCRERLPKSEVLASDCMRLPYRSGVFDAAISIAVLHHFSSVARRLRALSELCRLVRPGGKVLVYAWAIEQEQDSRRSFAAQDVLVPWHLADHHNRNYGRSSGSSGDAEDGGRGSNDTVSGQDSDEPTAVVAEHTGASAPAKPTEGVEARGKSSHVSGVAAPTPDAPRHGVRVDGVAGTAGSVVYQRYCHVYAEGELEGLVERVGGLRLVESYYDRSNWCVVAERGV